MEVSRRGFTRAWVAIAAALAGCLGGPGGGTAPDSPTAEPEPTADGAESTDAPADGTTTTAPSPTAEPKTEPAAATVELVDRAFDPVRASVATGATVRWVNRDGVGHDVTAAAFHDVAADWALSEPLSAGGSVSHRFEEPGVYEYACTVHGRSVMCGAILVGGATLDERLPCEGTETEEDDYGGGGYY